MPLRHQPDRDDDGNPTGPVYNVNRVTPENRWDVDPASPEIQIAIMSEDLSVELKRVYIPRTREMPDAVVHDGEYYEVSNTNLKPPQYRQCMVATAYDTPKGKSNGKEESESA